jgi:hypothetical protein
MLTGPIFSQEDEDDMMNYDRDIYAASPRVDISQEYSRGTVILDGEDEDDVAASTAGETFLPLPDVSRSAPALSAHVFNSAEYAFSFDFSAPTNMDSLQFHRHEEDGDAHSGSTNPILMARRYIKKNQMYAWLSLGFLMMLCGMQQLVSVKNDLAALRYENESLRATIESLQYEQSIYHANENEKASYNVLTSCLPVEAKAKIGECANHIYHHVSGLKTTFWQTADHIREYLEEELIGSEQPETQGDDGNVSGIERWFDKTGLKKVVDNTMQHIGSSKILIPLLFVSGASLLVDLFSSED